MSLFKSLFGNLLSGAGAASPKATAAAAPAKSMEHKGFTVSAAPFEQDGRYQTAGTIEKDVDGVRKQHRFIRADSHPSIDQAVEFSIQKGCQIVDQMGERVFAERT
jgi:hypothetical protein